VLEFFVLEIFIGALTLPQTWSSNFTVGKRLYKPQQEFELTKEIQVLWPPT
jgi:hypothetical protein